MIRVRAALLFAAGFALLVTSQARTQPGGFEFPASKTQTPTPLAVLVLNGIDDPALIAELKLSDEQVKTLVARRQAVWDEVYTTAPAKADAAARIAASDAALKKTLSEAQYKRATQLGAQRVVAGPTFGGKAKAGVPTLRVTAATLKSYPELAGVIKLTDAQQKTQQKTFTDPLGKGIGGKAGGGTFGGFTLTLTPEQQASVKEFLGPVLETGWVAKSDTRLRAIPNAPRELSIVEAKDVRADAAITDDQAKAIAAVREKWTKFSADRTTDLSPKEAFAVGTALLAETEKALAATLKPAQATRLKQIDRQVSGFRGFGTVTAESHVEQFYKTAAAAKEFDISAEQVTAIDGIWAAFRGDAAKVFEAGGPVEAIDAKVKALAAARRAKAEGVLTTAQTAKLRESYGAPFAGSTSPDSLRNQGFNIEEIRAAAFGKYTTEFTQLGRDKGLHAELKLTPEQVKQAEEIRVELLEKSRRGSPVDPDFYAERSAAVEAGLKKLLTADQAKRFREIMLQTRERAAATARAGRGISTAIPSGAAYPGVAEAIKLTADQKKSLLDGTAPAQVLTAEQKAAITKMLGAPYTPAPVATTLPRATQTLTILMGRNSVTAAALGLTPEQTQAIEAAQEKYQTTVRTLLPSFGGAGGGPATDPEARTKTLTAAIEEFETAATKVLTAEQKKRLPQIGHQVRAASNLELALTDDEVAKTLGLTADQTARLAALGDDAERLQALVMTHQADAAGQPLGLRLRDAADERMMAVLTDAQRAKWRELTGEPVQGLRKSLPGRFGPGGGFGGVGGFGGGPGSSF